MVKNLYTISLSIVMVLFSGCFESENNNTTSPSSSSSPIESNLSIANPDTTSPAITLIGSTIVNLIVGDIYTDAGAVANDNIDGNITADITVENPVDTSIAGTYAITYNVADAAGNEAIQVSRIVIVASDIIMPVLGEIEIDSIVVGITYNEELITSSNTTVEINGGNSIANQIIFSNSPDNTIQINADLSTYTIDNNFTVDITANIEDDALNADSTKITVIINP
ncbi:MAG: DUF5011 domain-containing protein [Sulfurimonas sp.]|nr:DUF5011 domain-containing protein [Sulfurimonas sp.]